MKYAEDSRCACSDDRRGHCGNRTCRCRLGGSEAAATSGRARQRYRPIQRQVVQPVSAPGPEPRQGRARSRHPSAPVELPSGLHPEPDDGGRPWRERDHLRRVPDGDGAPRSPTATRVKTARVRDHRLPGEVPPFNKNPNVDRADVRGPGGWLPRRDMAALMVKKQGGPAGDRSRRRDQDPAGRLLDRGLQVLREAREREDQGPGGYSQDFVQSDKCKAQAENLIARKAKVLFQVAGGCGLGTLKAADEARSGASASTRTSTTTQSAS